MSKYYGVMILREAEEILDFTIQAGESLLMYGVEDFGEILSWINLADLSLQVVPSCRESLNSCLDWNGSNKERLEIALSILRDAMGKVHNPIYSTLLYPSEAYLMLTERICGRSVALTSRSHPGHFSCLSLRDYLEDKP